MAYESSTTYLLTRLPHAGLYNYNGKQIEPFHMEWFVDRLIGHRLIVFVKCLTLVLVQRLISLIIS